MRNQRSHYYNHYGYSEEIGILFYYVAETSDWIGISFWYLIILLLVLQCLIIGLHCFFNKMHNIVTAITAFDNNNILQLESISQKTKIKALNRNSMVSIQQAHNSWERRKEGPGFLLIPCLITHPWLTPGQRPCRFHSNPSPWPTSKGPDYREEKNEVRERARERESERERTGRKDRGMKGRKDWNKEGGRSRNGNTSRLSPSLACEVCLPPSWCFFTGSAQPWKAQAMWDSA